MTLHSLCQEPASPGGAKPTYAPEADILSSLKYLSKTNENISRTNDHRVNGSSKRKMKIWQQ